MVVSLARLWSSHVRVASPGPRPGRPHLVARLHPVAPFPAAPPRAGPDSSRTSSGSAVAARRQAGAPAGSGLSGAGVGAAARTPLEAGPVGPRWAWRSRPSPRETVPGGGTWGEEEGSRGGVRGQRSDSEVAPGTCNGVGVGGRCTHQEETSTLILGGSRGQFSTTLFCARSPWGVKVATLGPGVFVQSLSEAEVYAALTATSGYPLLLTSQVRISAPFSLSDTKGGPA